ncbi:pentatricopeptide repeat-containing protein At1g05600 [Vigna angularis]|uniref:pentatricopeptide repeat-containing protein At1g05600 n=1 Tax=Phaseolus angularis TaxID=3914 RepID=UPI0022B58120|nr:pentatricopeptide repeat-containing protein At1g05600 [Vigna angularis]
MSIRWPRRLTPTYLSQIIRTQKNPIKALHIFNEAKSRYPNYCHNGPVYATMINILGTSGRLTEMRDVIEQMREDSCECKDSVFVSVIKTYANAGQVDEAMSLYKTIPQFNFVESSCGWEVRSRVRALNLLMYALCQKSRSDLALQLFQEMDYQSCYPNRDSYAILMKGLCQDRRLHEATHLLYSMFWRISQKGNGEDIVVYRTLLDALCDAGKLEEAVEILGKILRKGLKAPKRCYNHPDLGRFLDGKHIESAKHVIHLPSLHSLFDPKKLQAGHKIACGIPVLLEISKEVRLGLELRRQREIGKKGKVELKGWKKEEEKEEKEKVVMRRNAMGIWEEESWGRG